MKNLFKKLSLLSLIIATLAISTAQFAPESWAATMYLVRYEVNKLPVKVQPTALVAGTDLVPVFQVSTSQVVQVPLPASFTNGASPTLVTISSTATLTSANSGVTNVMSHAGVASTYTLPAATGSGKEYKFVVGAVNTSNYVINPAGSDKISGSLSFPGGTTSGFLATAASHITLNGTTTGGKTIGDSIILQDIGSGVWAIKGQVTSSGTAATPFS